MKSLKLIKLFVLLLFCLSAHSAPLDHWHWVAPLPQGNSLRNIQFINGRFLAVGEGGAVMHSADAANWTVAPKPDDITLLSAAYGNGVYVAGGAYGFIWVSADLETWTQASTPVFTAIHSITYGNGAFVAVTDGGEALKSTDGITWTQVLGPMLIDFCSVQFAQGQFWIAGGNSDASIYEIVEGTLLKSSDGNNWQVEKVGSRSMFIQVTQAGEELLVLELAGTLHIRSAPGMWRHYATPGYPLGAVTYGSGKYLVHSVSGSGVSYVGLVSTNGYQWTFVDGVGFYDVHSSAYGNGYFVLAGNGGQLLRSTDGEAYEPAIGNSLAGGTYGPMAYGDNRLLLAGYRFGETSYESAVLTREGEQSEFTMSLPEGLGGLHRIEWVEGKFIAAAVGQIAISENGIEWTVTSLPSAYESSDMLIVNDKIIVTTFSYPSTITILSLAGEILSHNTYPDYDNITEIEYGLGSYWMIGGYGNQLYRSADAVTWQLVTSELPVTGKLSAQGGRLVILGSGGVSATSTDGLNWRYGATGSEMTSPQTLRYVQGKYVALLNPYYSSTPIMKSQLVSSSDGLNWQVHPIFTFRGSDFVYGNGRYYVSGQAGNNNVVMESDFSVSLQLTRQADPSVIIDGPKEKYYRVLRSVALGATEDWAEIDRVFAPQMPFTYQDSSASGNGSYFYRAILESELVEE